ncbi:hypothetical protein BIW11_06601 [Tropilaelaps mercedesae]|uniref:Uncharacterized protein n=1 Tax=Tropilaelaps mercedesae TaxID=418985 RepID=A0A1V9XXH5_9ACAR|nr:hypothetical protein BIW11_06601 [Tropilaelaps mercedesae]
MFATQGRLSGVVCPLHVIGQCSRPYCHFKHTQNVPQQQAPAGGGESTEASTGPGVASTSGGSQSAPKPTPPPRSHIPAIRVPQYRPTPLAVLQRRQQNAAASIGRMLAGESSGGPSAGMDSDTSDRLVKADEASVVEPAFSEDEDDTESEQAVLMEIFHEDSSEARPAQIKEQTDIWAKDEDCKEQRYLEWNSHSESESKAQNTMVIDLTEEDSVDIKLSKYDDSDRSSEKRSRKDADKHRDRDSCKRKYSSHGYKEQDTTSNCVAASTSANSSRPKEEASHSSSSRKRHSTEHSSKSRTSSSSNDHHKDRNRDGAGSRSSSRSKDTRELHKESRHSREKESSSREPNAAEVRSKAESDKGSRERDRHRDKSKSSLSSRDRTRDSAKDKAKDRTRERPKEDKHRGDGVSGSGSGNRKASSTSKDRSSRSSHTKDRERGVEHRRSSSKSRSSNGIHRERKEDSNSENRSSSRRDEKGRVAPLDSISTKGRSWSEQMNGCSDSGGRSDDSRDHCDDIGSSGSESRDAHQKPTSTPPLIDVDLSDEDPEQECLRLFQECESQMVLNKDSHNDKQKQDSAAPVSLSEPSKVIDMVGVTRKRVAHDPGTRSAAQAPAVPKKPFRPSPAQQLAMRHEALQRTRQQQQQQQSQTGESFATPILHTTTLEQRRQRISTVSTGLVRAVVQRKGLALASTASRQAGAGTNPTLGTSLEASLIKRVANTVPLPHATNHVQAKLVETHLNGALVSSKLRVRISSGLLINSIPLEFDRTSAKRFVPAGYSWHERAMQR